NGGTMFALFRLRDKGLLSGPEYARLANAYQFLRYLEHRLQIEDDRQTHALPDDPDDLDLLARRMPPDTTGAVLTREAMLDRLDAHRVKVREFYERVINAQKPIYYTRPAPSTVEDEVEAMAPATNLTRSLDQRAPQLAEAVHGAHLHRGRERFEHFLEKGVVNGGHHGQH